MTRERKFLRAAWRGMLIAGMSAAAAAQPPAPSAGSDALQRHIERARETAAALEPADAREQRMRERSALLAQGEAALAQGEVDAALVAFERAALMLHAADTEIALVRTYMQAGEYRRAVSFSAHTAGAHRQVVAGAVLYAWLLSLGGQDGAARRLLDGAAQLDASDPMVRAMQRLLAAPTETPGGNFVEPPVRLAPARCSMPRVALPASRSRIRAAATVSSWRRRCAAKSMTCLPRR